MCVHHWQMKIPPPTTAHPTCLNVTHTCVPFISFGYLKMLSVSILYGIGLLNELWIGKDMDTDSWPGLTFAHTDWGIPWKHLSLDSQWPSWDSNQALSKYKSTALPLDKPVQSSAVLLSECIWDHKILGWGNNSDFSPEKAKNYPLTVKHGHSQTQWFSSEKWWCHITNNGMLLETIFKYFTQDKKVPADY
jgi:hypothetical protein